MGNPNCCFMIYTETCQVLLMFRLDFDQVLVGIFNPFQCLWMLWHLKNLDMSKFWSKNKNLNFLWLILWKMAMVLFVLLVSRVILLFIKSAIKNSNSYLLTKILTCPNFLDVRASTDVKRGQKFQLEPDQNPIRTWVEPDKSRCTFSPNSHLYMTNNKLRV